MKMSAIIRKTAGTCVLAGAVLASGACPAHTQQRTDAGPVRVPQSTIPVLMVSDIHFDPFHDPAKAKLLARDPVSEWAQVLAAPDSPGQAASFGRLQATCHASGVDTPWALLHSSVDAMRKQTKPQFVTLTGDLLAHEFGCRYQTMLGGSAAGYEAFAVKTLQFVVEQLHGALPGVPIYVNLGNNDSGCGDYRLDPDSNFLRQTAAIFARALPPDPRRAEENEFPAGGYYSVTMARPMRDTRLIVLNDVFLSPKYRTCGGKRDEAPGRAEIDWLRHQLKQAQQAGQNVWVMGHIPPGVNAYATIGKLRDVCGSGHADLFLVQSGLDDLLVQHAGEVRLALFGHTHMDEMRLLQKNSGGRGVAVKLVPSITPVHGNNPAFTVARVDPKTAVMKDYEVISASNRTGVKTQWSREYDYAQAYHQPNYTPASLRPLIDGFSRDPKAITQASQDYIRDYYVGGRTEELKPFWPLYVCSMDHLTARGYAACVCAAKPGAVH